MQPTVDCASSSFFVSYLLLVESAESVSSVVSEREGSLSCSSYCRQLQGLPHAHTSLHSARCWGLCVLTVPAQPLPLARGEGKGDIGGGIKGQLY